MLARLLLPLVALMTLLSLACASVQPNPGGAGGPGDSAGGGNVAQAPQRGGMLQFAPIKGGQTLHPHRGGSTDILRHTAAGYDTLLAFKYEPGKDYRASMELQPWLAESWQHPDELTYVFSIRKGVKWHDGTPFTAEDVAFTFNWLRQEKAPAASRLSQVDKWEVLDPSTLRVSLSRPAPDFLQEMGERNLLIIPKHVVQRGDDLNKVLVGTGSFKLKSFRSGTESLWERNEDYWAPGFPYLDGVRQIWGLEASAMLAAFVAQQNDLLATIDETQLDTVRAAVPNAGQQLLAAENGFSIVMKLDKPPFDDIRIRRALHLAVDRGAINDTLARGKGMYVPPGVWPGRQGWAIGQEELRKLPGYRSPKDQDIAEAKRLVAEAGYPQGVSFNLIYNAGGTVAPRMAEMLPTQLRPAGLNVTLKPLESGVYNQADIRTGDYDGANLPTLVDSQFQGLFDRLHSAGTTNKVGLKDPRLDALIETILSGKDDATRKTAARQIQDYLLERAYYVPLVELVQAAVWQPWVKDFVYTPGNAITPYGPVYPQTWLDLNAIPAGRKP